jgi:hypothetical protein
MLARGVVFRVAQHRAAVHFLAVRSTVGAIQLRLMLHFSPTVGCAHLFGLRGADVARRPHYQLALDLDTEIHVVVAVERGSDRQLAGDVHQPFLRHVLNHLAFDVRILRILHDVAFRILALCAERHGNCQQCQGDKNFQFGHIVFLSISIIRFIAPAPDGWRAGNYGSRSRA